MTIICLTGGIASGKTTAATFLEKQGAHVINADLLGHQAYLPHTRAFSQVRKTFGEEVIGIDGQIDRKVLGAKVFGNSQALKQLTDIVWPEIRRLAEAEIKARQSSHPSEIIVLEAAVLFEAGWEDIGDEIWTIIVDPEIAVTRASQRDGIDEDAVRQRIAAQLSNEQRAAKSTLIIENNGSEAEMLALLQTQWQSIGQPER